MQPFAESLADPLNAPAPTTPHLRIAHILFLDIVGYSKLATPAQAAVQRALTHLVQETNDVRRARAENTVLCRPTGDGMALLFFDDVLAPVRAAIALDGALRARAAGDVKDDVPPFFVRMGIHTGPVLMVEDLNAHSDVAGDGIVFAQRVMDCGDAGHLLVSEAMARLLEKEAFWHRYLHDIGACRDKHGLPMRLFSLRGRLDGARHGSVHATPFGNPAIPKKVFGDTGLRVDQAMRARETAQNETAARRGGNLIRVLLAGFTFLLLAGLAGVSAAAWLSRGRSVSTTAPWISRLHLPPSAAQGDSSPTGQVFEYGEGGTLTGGVSTPPSAGKRPEAGKGDVSALPPSGWRVRVPNVIGMSFEEAAERSEKSDFSGTIPDRIVYRQSPRGGQPGGADGVVRLRVSLGPRPGAEASEPTSPPDPPAPPDSSPASTGLLIDARHLSGLRTSQQAAVYGPAPADERLYPLDDAIPEEIQQVRGVVGYYHSESAARKRVGANALVVRAEGVIGDGGVRVSVADAKRIQDLDAQIGLNQSYNVGFLR